MKTVILSLVLLAGTLFAKAQTTMLNIQNASPCPVYYSLYAGFCGNPQLLTDSKVISAPAGANFGLPMAAVPWLSAPPLGSGIVGMRVYSDDPAMCPGATFIDVFAPVGGPLPAIGGPLFPSCSPCPPFQTFFETYCGNSTNIFRFF